MKYIFGLIFLFVFLRYFPEIFPSVCHVLERKPSQTASITYSTWASETNVIEAVFLEHLLLFNAMLVAEADGKNIEGKSFDLICSV